MSAYASVSHAVLPGDPHWTFGYRKPQANRIYRKPPTNVINAAGSRMP